MNIGYSMTSHTVSAHASIVSSASRSRRCSGCRQALWCHPRLHSFQPHESITHHARKNSVVAHSLGFEYLQPWQKRRLEEAFAQGKRKVKVGGHLASDSMPSSSTPKQQMRLTVIEPSRDETRCFSCPSSIRASTWIGIVEAVEMFPNTCDCLKIRIYHRDSWVSLSWHHLLTHSPRGNSSPYLRHAQANTA